ncbi:UDP-N-acetylglucosamine 1-carboxyvinyltransferase [Methylacidiphilum caldifontis]|uniref:UDP-N-acetylglucosamine 1-carboxyvinyltransferase n=1 Tax=Methylacidiphilum caldifontis TaxID=2795386 RepID=A0A4Y8PFL5_9BACT|nr:UDP-N-acetylglucosamine 1-carboxyvinyltransferase [Methylacidiphilum caldifontis]TFE70647.1 UDP-N-acetylglucosamine 1-carboxyvinyltransferase [Methylacidiphilum caldifontis]
MEKFIIKGGNPLTGKITISGSKNSALPILAATLLTPEECVIHRVPNLSDIRYMLEILKFLGAQVHYDKGTVRVKNKIVNSTAPYDLVRKMRASICILGPLIARCGKARVSLPGGCVIGDRPIDLHIMGLQKLGADIEIIKGDVVAHGGKLQGTSINLKGKYGSTVLGTDNVMMAACQAEGTTIIEGAACEPEVEDLAHFLSAMGAKISGMGTQRLVIEGIKELHGCEYTIITDRIEAGTFAVAAAMTKGNLLLEQAPVQHMKSVLEKLKDCGVSIEIENTGLRVSRSGPLRAFEIVTAAYPGFPTDMQAQFCAMATIAEGTSKVVENIFPNRFMHISELKRLGANIEFYQSEVIIHGIERLSGAPVMASDLRASAALVLAGLVAENTTEVHRVYHIDRGYEKIDQKLSSVGAHISRVYSKI